MTSRLLRYCVTASAPLLFVVGCSQTDKASAPASVQRTPQTTTSGEEVTSAAKPVTESYLRELFVTQRQLPSGWIREESSPSLSPPSTADKATCQPILDHVAGVSTRILPDAVVDLRLTEDYQKSEFHIISLASFPPGDAERTFAEARAGLASCSDFVSTGVEGAVAMKIAARYETIKLGDDALAVEVTATHLDTTYQFRVLLVRIGMVIVRFNTSGAGIAQQAPIPESIVRAQLDKVTAAALPRLIRICRNKTRAEPGIEDFLGCRWSWG